MKPRKWTKGAKWDLMVRFEDGLMYRLSSTKEKKHTNKAMLDSIDKDFLPMFAHFREKHP